jgi:hypothetical protein
MKKNVVIPTLILLAFSGASFAGKYPQLKPGLWETKSNISGSMNTIKQCMDAKTLADSEKQSDDYVKANCNNIKDSRSGNVYTTEMTCKLNGKPSQQKTVVKVISANEIENKNITVIDGKSSVMQTHSKRLGDCSGYKTSVSDPSGNMQSLEALIEQAKASQKKH